MTYKSVYPTNEWPETFTTGGYEAKSGKEVFRFDFEEMEASVCYKDGHLYIESLQKNIDYDYSGIKSKKLDKMLRSLRAENLTEVYYECSTGCDEDENSEVIELIPLKMRFADNHGNMLQELDTSTNDTVNGYLTACAS
jgi:hypothetical protein